MENKDKISKCCKSLARYFKTETDEGFRCQSCRKKCEPIEQTGKGKRSYKKGVDRKTGKDEEYAYTFKDSQVGSMKVLNTANAWWLDAVKIHKLVDAYKFYATNEQACFYAGISRDQLEYFQKLHRDFYGIKHACKQNPGLLAKKRLVLEIEKNSEIAKWFLERTEKETFSSRVEQTGANGRDLYDQQTEKLNDLINHVKKHTGKKNTNNNDAGQNGDGNDTSAPGDERGDEIVSA